MYIGVMPSFRSKYAKKPRKKTYSQYKSKKMSRMDSRSNRPFKTTVGTTRNTNVLNKLKDQVVRFKDTINFQNLVGTGGSISGLQTFDIAMTPRYASLVSMFRQYRLDFIKIRMRLRSIELSDGAQHPNLLIRYNYDPNLAIGSVNEAFMLRQTNCVIKQFIHNTPEGVNLEYTFKPAVMHALKVWNVTNYVPQPQYNQWCDFTGTSTAEIDHYGIVYWISNLPVDQVIDFDLQYNYSCRDII